MAPVGLPVPGSAMFSPEGACTGCQLHFHPWGLAWDASSRKPHWTASTSAHSPTRCPLWEFTLSPSEQLPGPWAPPESPLCSLQITQTSWTQASIRRPPGNQPTGRPSPRPHPRTSHPKSSRGLNTLSLCSDLASILQGQAGDSQAVAGATLRYEKLLTGLQQGAVPEPRDCRIAGGHHALEGGLAAFLRHHGAQRSRELDRAGGCGQGFCLRGRWERQRPHPAGVEKDTSSRQPPRCAPPDCPPTRAPLRGLLLTVSCALVRSSRVSHAYSPASSSRRPDTVSERRGPAASIWKRLPARSCVLPQRHMTSAWGGLSSQTSVTAPPSSPLTGSRGRQNLAATSAGREGHQLQGSGRGQALCPAVVGPESPSGSAQGCCLHDLTGDTPVLRPPPAHTGFPEDRPQPC